MATEDFSFPIIEDNFPCTIDSPPLWHLSPTASPPNGSSAKGEDDDKDCFPIKYSQRKSFSCVEGGSGKLVINDGKEEDDEEEKMDMLWEDFNEELSKTCSSRSNIKSSSRDNMLGFGCVKALTTSKNNTSATLSTRKPGIVVIMKVLKKFFLLQNSHRKLQRPTS
jgi:hypothetical protein